MKRIIILSLLLTFTSYGQAFKPCCPIECDKILECVPENLDNDPANECNSALTVTGSTITITDPCGSQSATLPISLDNDPANECNTALNFNNTTRNLTITDGCGTETVNIPGGTNTDNQTLTIDCNTDRLTISGGNTVDLTCCPTWTVITAPAIVPSGTLSITLEQVLETDRYWVERFPDCGKREVYEFQYRVRVTQTAANGWAILTVPNVGGFDRKVYDVGSYRQNGNLNNPDNPTQGAMPDAPYMGAEAHEWSNSGRIYLNQFRDKDNQATVWVEFTAQYRRN